MALPTWLPMMVSLPDPPVAFSIQLTMTPKPLVTAAAMARLFTWPPTELKLSGLRSMDWFWPKPETSSVSMPPASQIAMLGAVFCVKS